MVPWLDAAYFVNAERVLLLYVQVRHNHPKTTVSDIKAARMKYYKNVSRDHSTQGVGKPQSQARA